MRSFITISLVSFISLTLGLAFAGSKHININDETIASHALKTDLRLPDFGMPYKLARPFFLNPLIAKGYACLPGDSLQLDLFPGHEYVAVFQENMTDIHGIRSLVYKIAGFDFSYGFIAVSDDACIVSIDIPERQLQFVTRMHPAEGMPFLLLIEGGPSGHMTPGDDFLIAGPERGIFDPGIGSDVGESIQAHAMKSNPGPDDPAQIDVLVVYTGEAMQWAKTNEGNIFHSLALAMTRANLVVDNSQLGIEFVLVHAEEVLYPESGGGMSSSFFQSPEITTLRNTYGADLVALITATGQALSFGMSSKFGGSESMAFFTANVKGISGSYVFMHEMSHNMGAGHHKQQDFQPGPTAWTDWPENVWSAGWRWVGSDYKTYGCIMSYPCCYPDGIANIMVPYMSNPLVLHMGQPTGHPQHGDNARTMKEVKHTVAAYRNAQGILPTVTTAIPNMVDQHTAFSGGQVTAEGNSQVTARGVVWGLSPHPTISNNNFSVNGTGLGYFNSLLQGLTPGVTYYLRAYATNDDGTAYGHEEVFVTNAIISGADFITLWELNPSQSSIRFLAERAGVVVYRWETLSASQQGFGALSEGYGMVEIPGLPEGETIRLKLTAGNLKRFYQAGTLGGQWTMNPDRHALLAIEQWGTAKWNSMQFAFYECAGMDMTAQDVPDLSDVQNMGHMFYGCSALQTASKLGLWDVSGIRRMNSMFYHASLFNADISSWDVSNVNTMSNMFSNATAFNQSIDTWDVSSVTNMDGMFHGATWFNKPLSSWDVSAVQNMSAMFFNASAFDQHLDSWDVSSVKQMSVMFLQATSFNGNISTWNVLHVTDMHAMFKEASNFNSDIGAWDVSSVTNMRIMFEQATSFDQDISYWDVSLTEDFRGMFNMASAFNQNLAGWDLASATQLQNMLSFSGMDCIHYSSTLIGWAHALFTPDNLTLGADGLIYGSNAAAARANLQNRGWTFSNDSEAAITCLIGRSPTVKTIPPTHITNTSALSGGVISYNGGDNVTANGLVWGYVPDPTIENAIGFRLSTLTHIGTFTETLSGLDPYTNYYIRAFAMNDQGIAYGRSEPFTTWSGGQNGEFITRWQLPPAQEQLSFFITATNIVAYTWETVPAHTSGSGTFDPAGGLVTIQGLPTGKTIRLYLQPDNLIGFSTFGMHNSQNIASPDKDNLLLIEQWGTTQWTTMENAFRNATNLNITATDIPILDLVINFNQMFMGCSALNGPANINQWNVSNVTSMRWVFQSATSFNQAIGQWDVSGVTDMTYLFFNATSFNQDISSWDVSSVNMMIGTFNNTTSFNQPLGAWNVANVKNMSTMFASANLFNQDIGNWHVGSVQDMRSMFMNASRFNQDISNWDVSNVMGMEGMFYGATQFNQDISSWDVGKVRNMGSMFYRATAFNQDVSTWDVSKVQLFRYMFDQAVSFNQNLAAWDLSESQQMQFMFDNCGMDCTNYSLTMIGWSQHPHTPANMTLGASGRQYGNNAVPARNALLARQWVINGDAPSGTDCLPQPIADHLVVDSQTIQPGADKCFNALQTITVGGNGNNLIVESGGNAIFIAGASITFLPGVMVKPGAFMHAYITETGIFCPAADKQIPSVEAMEVVLQAVPALEQVSADRGELLIYPNPVVHTVYVEPRNRSAVPGADSPIVTNTLVTIEVIAINGISVMRKTSSYNHTYAIDLTGIPSGIYFIRLIEGNNYSHGRIVKTH